VNQVQIHPKSGFQFAQGLRAILRQDPNVIMIGEIRDIETANIAIRAALSGHLVLTSLHTADSVSAITRLLDMNIEPYRLSAALTGVIAQRLIRLICSHCQGKRCHVCQYTGYYGRTGAFEVLELDEEARRAITQNLSLSELRSLLKRKGLRTLQQTVMKKVNRQLTTIEEWTRVVDSVEEKLVER
jgi:general secretion pathway protein E